MGRLSHIPRADALHGFLFVVADGVGGMDFGEVASSTAVSVLADEFAKAPSGSMLIQEGQLTQCEFAVRRARWGDRLPWSDQIDGSEKRENRAERVESGAFGQSEAFRRVSGVKSASKPDAQARNVRNRP